MPGPAPAELAQIPQFEIADRLPTVNDDHRVACYEQFSQQLTAEAATDRVEQLADRMQRELGVLEGHEVAFLIGWEDEEQFRLDGFILATGYNRREGLSSGIFAPAILSGEVATVEVLPEAYSEAHPDDLKVKICFGGKESIPKLHNNTDNKDYSLTNPHGSPTEGDFGSVIVPSSWNFRVVDKGLRLDDHGKPLRSLADDVTSGLAHETAEKLSAEREALAELEDAKTNVYNVLVENLGKLGLEGQFVFAENHPYTNDPNVEDPARKSTLGLWRPGVLDVEGLRHRLELVPPLPGASATSASIDKVTKIYIPTGVVLVQGEHRFTWDASERPAA